MLWLRHRLAFSLKIAILFYYPVNNAYSKSKNIYKSQEKTFNHTHTFKLNNRRQAMCVKDVGTEEYLKKKCIKSIRTLATNIICEYLENLHTKIGST